ncbi:MAG: glycoside hydrolase family protein [Verrucomicrobiales bacterium]|nr:glycoside hydrolase family protein [Verrucomicrobiales bacterium]
MPLKTFALVILLSTWATLGCRAANWTVYMTGADRFSPATLTITAGDSVTWINIDDFDSHDATANDGSWTSGELDLEESATVTFPTAGTFGYLDLLWGVVGMKGTITVKALVLVPPTISLTAPVSGSVFHTKSVFTLQASPMTTGTTVSKVEFYSGANLLGTATAIPWSIVVSNFTAKVYSLTAKVTDSQNQIVTSGSVAITVVTPIALNLSVTRTTGLSTLKLTTTSGLTYVLEKCDVLSGTWTGLSTNVANASSLSIGRNTSGASEFYRAYLK